MHQKPTLYVPDYKGYAEPFKSIFDLTDDIQKADALMLTGGEDIGPYLYGEKPGSRTYFNPRRDQYEKQAYEIAYKRGIPVLGICRGAQFLCAMAGGKLVQHVTGHGRSHLMQTHDGRSMVMSSLHHQMLRPEETEHVMIAWAAPPRSTQYLGQNDEELYGHELVSGEGGTKHSAHREPEIVWFPKIKGLAIQGHPEMMPHDDPAVEYCRQLVKEKFFGE